MGRKTRSGYIVFGISGFRPGVLEALDRVGCYVLLVDSWLPMFWDSLRFRLQKGEACVTLEEDDQLPANAA